MPSILQLQNLAQRSHDPTASSHWAPAPIIRRSWTGDQLLRSPYGYLPALSAPLVFVILYFISALWHLAQNFRYRQWWLTVLTIGCFAEAGGNALRVYGHYNPFNAGVYTAMQCILVLTPALFAAIDFAILARLTTLFPSKYSLVNPRWILPFFVALDFSSLAVQGGGAGVAASAQADGQNTQPGGNIVVAGLAVQLVGYILFNTLLVVFVRRCIRDPPSYDLWNKRTMRFIAATAASSALIFVRSIFRLIEMSVGWEGVIARSEWAFYTFDAAMVTIAVYIFNVANPAAYLPRHITSGKSHGDDKEGTKEASHYCSDSVKRPTFAAPKDSEESKDSFNTDLTSA